MAMKYIKLFESWRLMEGEDDIDTFISSSPKKFPVLDTTIGNYKEAVDDGEYETLIKSLIQRAKQDIGSNEFNVDAGKNLDISLVSVDKTTYADLLGDNRRDKPSESKKKMNNLFGQELDINDLNSIVKEFGLDKESGLVYKVKEGNCVLFLKDSFDENMDPKLPITQMQFPGNCLVLVEGNKYKFPIKSGNSTIGQVLAFVNQGISMENVAILSSKLKEQGEKLCAKIFGGEGKSSLGKFAQTVKIGGQNLKLANGENGTIIPLYVAKDVMGTCGFDFNKATLKEDAKDTLSKKELWAILTNAKNTIEIIGHTDSVGKEDVNKDLSKQRAESVLKFLQSMKDEFQKITQKKIKVTTTGKGFEEMVQDDKGGKDKDAAAKNRRVVIKVDGVGPDYKALLK